MNIRRKFLQLTSYTYPFGTEGFLKQYLPVGFKSDDLGNYYFIIGDNPTSMFTCHLDTACDKQEKVTHEQSERYIKTNGKTILGADDKAGMVVLLQMIEKKVPGVYYFFMGEEAGCVGSCRVAEKWDDFEFSKPINKIISFDRRGLNSVITHQFYGRCCSEFFGDELADRLNKTDKNLRFVTDNTGILTDSAAFMYMIPECTNISVGYDKEHTFKENQDILFLQALCRAVCKVDWESLPILRDPFCEDFTPYTTIDDEFDDVDDNRLQWSEKYFSFFVIGKEVKKMFISKSQINREKPILHKWIRENGIDVLAGRPMGCNNNASFEWNGNELLIENESGKLESIIKRIDIMKIIPSIGPVTMEHLRFDPNVELGIIDLI